MPPSDVQIALLLQSQYDETTGIFDYQAVTNEVSWAVKHFDDCDVIAFEGSHNLPDWERDFQANMIHVEGLGGVHAGFYSGLPETFAASSTMFSKDKPLLVIGHSLGGGETYPFAGLLANAGYTKVETVTFGSPFAGNEDLAKLISPFPDRSYWNAKDPFNSDIVGTVPLYIPYFEPYVIPLTRRKFWSPPTPSNPWGQGHYLAPHNLKDCYIPGVENYGQSNTIA